MNFLKKITHIGTKTEDHKYERRAIILSNSISLVLTTAILLLINIRYFFLKNMTQEWFLHDFIPGFISFITPLILNSFYFTKLSRIILCVIPPLYLWFAFSHGMISSPVSDQGLYYGLRLYLLAISPIPYLLFNKESKFILAGMIMISLISFLCFDQILRILGVNDDHMGLPKMEAQLVNIRSIIGYIVIGGACYAFQTIITQSDELNEKMMAEIRNKSEEIETQNEELIQSQDNLNDLYKNLEKLVALKTEAITLQNEKILQYTFANSHLVRASVARISGLLYLSHLDPNINFDEIMNKLDHEINELDLTTKNITHELEKM